MKRLLERARRRDSDPQVFAGLVPALRFCGLLEESVAAHDRARRLDPTLRTGVCYTYYVMGEWEKAIESDDETPRYCRFLSLDRMGRLDEAEESLRSEIDLGFEGLEAIAVRMTLAAMQLDRERVRAQWDEISKASFRDPEGTYFMMRNLARVGEVEMALMLLQRIVKRGFHCAAAIEGDPWLELLRTEPEFYELVDEARNGSAAAEAEFHRLGGLEVLGLAPVGG
jgi:pentatricopeptide repeat protein